LFLLANALFFALQSLTGTSILSTPLASHLHGQDWSPLARSLVAQRLEARHETLAGYAPIFDAAALLNAKALIILMALVFAPLPALAFRRPKRPLGVHVVFSLHLYTMVLLLFCLSLLLAALERLAGGDGLISPRVDMALSVFNLSACAIYLYLAIGPAYGSRGKTRIVQAILLAVAVAAIVIGYRLAIFLVTLWTS
jgi:hypothetical protein